MVVIDARVPLVARNQASRNFLARHHIPGIADGCRGGCAHGRGQLAKGLHECSGPADGHAAVHQRPRKLIVIYSLLQIWPELVEKVRPGD